MKITLIVDNRYADLDTYIEYAQINIEFKGYHSTSIQRVADEIEKLTKHKKLISSLTLLIDDVPHFVLNFNDENKLSLISSAESATMRDIFDALPSEIKMSEKFHKVANFAHKEVK